MTEFSGPFDGSPIETVDQHRQRNRWPDGVDSGQGSSALQVTAAGDGLSANIAAGHARVQGALYSTDDTVNMASSANGGGSGRPDRLVLRYDGTQVIPVVKEGTPGGSVPSLSQSHTGTWEIPLARWVRAAGGGITSLVDERIHVTQSGDLTMSDAAVSGGVSLSNLIPSAGRRRGQRVTLFPSGDRFEWDGSSWGRLARGAWEGIVSGALISGNTNFQIAPGRYDMIKVYLRGTLGGDGLIQLRVNNDSTASLHRRARTTRRLDTGGVVQSAANDGTTWWLADWRNTVNNIAEATIYRTHLSGNLSFKGGGHAPTASTAARWNTDAGGDLSASRLLSSLFVVSAGASISTCLVWIEGHLA